MWSSISGSAKATSNCHSFCVTDLPPKTVLEMTTSLTSSEATALGAFRTHSSGIWEWLTRSSAVEKGGDYRAHPVTGSWFGFPACFNQRLPPFRVEVVVPDASANCETFICPWAGRCKSLYRLEKHSASTIFLRSKVSSFTLYPLANVDSTIVFRHLHQNIIVKNARRALSPPPTVSTFFATTVLFELSCNLWT